MAYDLFQKIVDEASGWTRSINLHHRGEPLLHEELPRMIRYCRHRGIYTQIHTNATLLTEAKSREIIESGLDFISFSVDGFDKASYEAIRVGAVFEETMENIRIFLEMRRKMSRKKPYTVLETIDFFQGDHDQMEKIREQVQKLQPDRWVLKPAHNWGGGYDPGGGEKDRRRFLSLWPACTFPWYALTLLWDGSAAACPQDFFGRTVMGNVSDSTLSHLWNSSVQVELRRKLKRGNLSPPCSKCDRPGRKGHLGIPVRELKPFLRELLQIL